MLGIRQKTIINTFVILVIVFAVLSLYQYYDIKKVQELIFKQDTRGYKPDIINALKNKEFILCNYNVYKPELIMLTEYYFPNFSKPMLSAGFYTAKKQYIIFGDWEFDFTGSTRIYNLSFSQALQMLKEDCSQFKQDYNYEETYGDSERQKNEVYWKYSRKTNLDDINIVEEGKEAVTNETETKIDKEWLEQNLKEYGFDNNEIKDILNKE